MSEFIDTHDKDYMEGLRLFYLKQYTQATALLTAAAERGSVKAQHFLAMMYENGNGVERDFSRAAYWYGMTAEHGDREAQLTYSMICALGKGIEPDIAKACHWATVSLHQGNAKAAQTLQILRAQAGEAAAAATRAFIAASEKGDREEAARQLQIAAECGDANAQFAYYRLLYNGDGEGEEAEEARRSALLWLQDAAAQGHAEAAKLLKEGFEHPEAPAV